jgi:glycosyltransferase involved in cell wall biosynthesis
MAKIAVVCLTYNHEQVLGRCLDSILAQDAIDDVDIILHDDASIDGTAEIVKEYSKRYPKTITPILQADNQYSQGVNILIHYILPNITSEYVAFCEGDDFWTDRRKLSLQLSKLEEMQEVDACFHSHEIFDNCSQTFSDSSQKGYGGLDRLIGAYEFVRKGSGSIATNSLFIRASTFRKNVRRFQKAPTNDYYLKLSGFFENRRAYFISRSMSAYRVNVKGSWSQRAVSFDRKQLTNQILRHYSIHINLVGHMSKVLIALSSARLTIFNLGVVLKNQSKKEFVTMCIRWVPVFSKQLILLLLAER